MHLYIVNACLRREALVLHLSGRTKGIFRADTSILCPGLTLDLPSFYNYKLHSLLN